MLLSQQRFIYSRLWFFQWSCTAVRVGLWRNLRAKEWCFWTVVLEQTLESPLDCKEIQPFHPKVNESWVFIGRTDAEAESPILWPSHVKSWLTGKVPDSGRGWGQEKKGTTEDDMAGQQLSELQKFVMDREAWRAVFHGVSKNRTLLIDLTELREILFVCLFCHSSIWLFWNLLLPWRLV